jgi:hypothetical protein
MDEPDFYNILLAPIVAEYGPLDPKTLTAIVGFDAGGPISLRTVGDRRKDFVTYVTCELAVREDQIPSETGRYELLTTCDDETWAREILTHVGQMTIESAFGHGHTLDIAP